MLDRRVIISVKQIHVRMAVNVSKIYKLLKDISVFAITICILVCFVINYYVNALDILNIQMYKTTMSNIFQFVGDYCEIEIEQGCPISWWGHPVCGPCNCPIHLGFNPDCNKTTGECYCKVSI